MTINELNDLIARGAAQPGVADAMELMRLSQDLERQTRDFVEIYGSVSTSAVTSSSGIIGPIEPQAAPHANLG
jgi:hypothetical protein